MKVIATLLLINAALSTGMLASSTQSVNLLAGGDGAATFTQAAGAADSAALSSAHSTHHVSHSMEGAIAIPVNNFHSSAFDSPYQTGTAKAFGGYAKQWKVKHWGKRHHGKMWRHRKHAGLWRKHHGHGKWHKLHSSGVYTIKAAEPTVTYTSQSASQSAPVIIKYAEHEIKAQPNNISATSDAKGGAATATATGGSASATNTININISGLGGAQASGQQASQQSTQQTSQQSSQGTTSYEKSTGGSSSSTSQGTGTTYTYTAPSTSTTYATTTATPTYTLTDSSAAKDDSSTKYKTITAKEYLAQDTSMDSTFSKFNPEGATLDSKNYVTLQPNVKYETLTYSGSSSNSAKQKYTLGDSLYRL